jgi:heat shock protein beta
MKMIKVMSKKLVKKALEMLKNLAEEDEEEEEEEEDEENKDEKKDEDKKQEEKEKKDKEEKKEEEEDTGPSRYEKFWNNYGKNIKLGVIEDAANRNKLAKLLRFKSTNDPEKVTSLDDYISRMKDTQDTILYLPGDSKEAILKSPILKKYVKKGYEVLILDDPIDEFCTQHLTEYEKRKVKSIGKDDVNLLGEDDVEKKKLKKLKEMYKPLTDWWKKHLGSSVEKVTVTNKLEDDPLYIMTS